MPDKECNHRWVAPIWVRTYPDGRSDLPVICRDCGILNAMKSTDLSTLKIVNFLAQNLGKDCSLQLNTLEFVKLTRR